jgi:hypothetical protein
MFAGKSLLLTGGTGKLGTVVLRRFWRPISRLVVAKIYKIRCAGGHQKEGIWNVLPDVYLISV